jgi:enoyl-CoA hydratase/carnithine racemase
VSVLLTEVRDQVGRITLNRPEQMNALTVELGGALHRAIEDMGSRDDVAVVLIRGAGGNFSAGGDFHEIERLRTGGPDALLPLFTHFAAACKAAGRIPQPVVAAVEGVAVAGGFELMQAVDIVLVHEKARLRDTHIVFGQVPGGGGSQRLPRLVGRQRAMGHLLGGEYLTPAEAVEWGLAHRVLPEAGFDEALEGFVQKLAGRRRSALTGIKRLVREGMSGSLQEGLALEMSAVVSHISGDAGDAGVSAFTRKASS